MSYLPMTNDEIEEAIFEYLEKYPRIMKNIAASWDSLKNLEINTESRQTRRDNIVKALQNLKSNG